MVDLQTRLEAAVTKLETDSSLMHTIVHGSTSTTVTTEGGVVPSIAKTINDAASALNDANGAATTVVNNYIYDSTVTMASPTTGKIRLNNATISSVTQIAIMNTANDSGNPDMGAYINTWDDAANTSVKGYLFLRKKGSPSIMAVFAVTGNVVDNATWKQIPVTYIGGSGTLTNNDQIYIGFNRAGPGLTYSNTIWGPTSTGSANAQVSTPSPAYTAYGNGDNFFMLPGFTNTGSMTLAFGSAGVKNAKKVAGSGKQNLAANDLVSGVLSEWAYDGTDLVLINPQTDGSAIGSAISAAATLNLDNATGDIVDINPGSDITAITLKEGSQKIVRMNGVFKITPNSNLILPGSVQITTAIGDTALIQGFAGGIVRIMFYQYANGNNTAAVRNKLYNGEFKVQRRPIGAVDNNYVIDRWRMLLGASTAAVFSKTTTGTLTNSGSGGRLTVGAAANNKFGFWQILEYQDVLSLRGQVATLSAQIKATAGISDVRMAIVSWAGSNDDTTTGGANLSIDPISSWNAQGAVPTYITNFANVNTPTNLGVGIGYAQYSVSGIIPSGASNFGVFIWSEDTTTTTTTDYLEISQVQLELGGATPFASLPYGEDLRRCQRYFLSSFPEGILPANAADTNLKGLTTQYSSEAGYFGVVMWRFPTTMRSDFGVITTYNPTQGNSNFRNNANSADITYGLTAAVSKDGAMLVSTNGVNSTVFGIIHATNDCEI